MPSIASGSTALTIGVPATLQTISTEGTYCLKLDMTNAQNGDDFQVREKDKVGSGGTTRNTRVWNITHAQLSEPIKLAAPIYCLHEVVYEIVQTAGTGRTISWEVVRMTQ